jgi:hypothetical protein
VRPAPHVALVLAVGPVLGEGAPAAVRPTRPELLVERVQDLAVDLTDLDLADQRPDVVVDERLVAVQRGRLDVQHLTVPVEELVDGCSGARVAPFVDLGEQPGTCLLRLASGAWPGQTISVRWWRLPLSGSMPA